MAAPFTHDRTVQVYQDVSGDEFTDIAGTLEAVTVPNGTAFTTWTAPFERVGGVLPYSYIRPAVRPHAPSGEGLRGQPVEGVTEAISGSWTTTVDAGEIAVGLQARTSASNQTIGCRYGLS